MTDDDAVSVVELESGAIARLAPGRLEPFRIDPEVGMNMALSYAVEAANDVEQATVALRPLGPLFHVPLLTDNVWPCWGAPLIAGN